MVRDGRLLELVGDRRFGRRIGALAAAVLAVGASPASAQYGANSPLPALPPLQGATTPVAGTAAPAGSRSNASPAPVTGAPTTAGAATGSAAGAENSGVAGAVGSGNTAVPVAGTAGAVRNTGVDAPTVRVVSSERAAPVALGGGDLPFTGARIGLLAAIGAGLLALGLGVRRRSAAARP
ncbi:MAG: hypothetical protein QOG42_1872 [Solirubrobacteraceae bacterium]|jgi:hypothetical protein|nr:hypothetical protein [Solirubrobacteraceae bacterium]